MKIFIRLFIVFCVVSLTYAVRLLGNEKYLSPGDTLELPSRFITDDGTLLQIHPSFIGRGSFSYVFSMVNDPSSVLKVSTMPPEIEQKMRMDHHRLPSQEIACLKLMDEFRGEFTYKTHLIIKMKRHQGHSLIHYLNNHLIRNSDDLVLYGEAAFEALRQVHAKGIVHNDLHLNNILFEAPSSPSKTVIAHIVDYGVAEDIHETPQDTWIARQFDDEVSLSDLFIHVAAAHFGSPDASTASSVKSRSGSVPLNSLESSIE